MFAKRLLVKYIEESWIFNDRHAKASYTILILKIHFFSF